MYLLDQPPPYSKGSQFSNTQIAEDSRFLNDVEAYIAAEAEPRSDQFSQYLHSSPTEFFQVATHVVRSTPSRRTCRVLSMILAISGEPYNSKYSPGDLTDLYSLTQRMNIYSETSLPTMPII